MPLEQRRKSMHIAGGAASSVAPAFPDPSKLRALLKADADDSGGVDAGELADIFAELGETSTRLEEVRRRARGSILMAVGTNLRWARVVYLRIASSRTPRRGG